MDFFEGEQKSFFQRHRWLTVVLVLAVVACAVGLGYRLMGKKKMAGSESRVVMVTLPPPPPPAPATPPPTPPPPMEQRMIAQDPVDAMEFKTDTPTEAPADAGPGVTTGIVGDGPGDGFGLRAGSRGGIGTGNAVSQKKASRWGWYAAQVQGAVSQALQNNKNTRYGDFRVETRIWADESGKITRARIAHTTGNATVDHAITNEVLAGLILQEPPPAGMPMPIVLRLTARPAKIANNK
jgi:outer membrane biosynthesis protein TonB